MIKYEKSKEDEQKEKRDLKYNHIMQFLQNQENLKFKIGDILIKQNRYTKHNGHDYDFYWEHEKHPTTKCPKKYMYVFENELGIGYVKQLKVDGTGFTTTLLCLANIDHRNTKFTIDPEYVDHIILNDGVDFQHNREYLEKRKFREAAMAANKNILLNTKSPKELLEWMKALKAGDIFWAGETYDELSDNAYEVTKIEYMPSTDLANHIIHMLHANGIATPCDIPKVEVKTLDKSYGAWRRFFHINNLLNLKLTMQKPFPLEDKLCGQIK